MFVSKKRIFVPANARQSWLRLPCAARFSVAMDFVALAQRAVPHRLAARTGGAVVARFGRDQRKQRQR